MCVMALAIQSTLPFFTIFFFILYSVLFSEVSFLQIILYKFESGLQHFIKAHLPIQSSLPTIAINKSGKTK